MDTVKANWRLWPPPPEVGRPPILPRRKIRSDFRYHWYKAFVVAGATEHALPPEYIASLKNVASLQDPDASRRMKNDALLTRATKH
jgi:hypothetical protein